MQLTWFDHPRNLLIPFRFLVVSRKSHVLSLESVYHVNILHIRVGRNRCIRKMDFHLDKFVTPSSGDNVNAGECSLDGSNTGVGDDEGEKYDMVL